MYIKSMVIDGFKSYGTRTEMMGFDRGFNAITGLNGTGKSNVLDAICFVLGITNLSHLRASSLQELIFGRGQSGVTKATVSLTFDNTNPDQSPPGFEDYNEITITRQVIMGGKNKYLLNGSVVPNKRIQDLFGSVQLNVNNPHFLIMQGRITKVLNMKPYEILSMVEEAAGTRMYETKRQAAQQLIEKKDQKLVDLKRLIDESIGPKLESLREQRMAYFEFQRTEREIGHLLVLFQALQYVNAKRANVYAQKSLEQVQERVQLIKDKIKLNNDEVKKLDAEIETMAQSLETNSGRKLEILEAELKEKEKIETKAISAEKAVKNNIAAEEKKKRQFVKNLNDDEAALKNKQKDLSKLQGLFQQLKDADAADSEALALAQKKFEAVSVGMEINDAGETQTLQEQLISAKQQESEANTEVKQANMQLTRLQSQLKEKEKKLGCSASDYQRDKANLDSVEKEVKALEKNLNKLNYSEERMNEVQNRRRVLLNEIKGLQERIERFETYYRYTNFQYRDPETNFNRRSVNGVVCRLFTLKDRETSTALETAAGGKLYNVVVDTDVTGKKLLQRGNLQNRTTFIPLNKIQTGKLDPRVVKIAQDLVGKENVQPALSLINYDRHLQPAMEFVFGNVFICRDLNIARKVTFNDHIRCKCVTLDGDVTDPAGTLSGGARKKEASVLIQLEEIMNLEGQLSTLQQELVHVDIELQKLSGVQEQWDFMHQQLELREHELGVVRERLQQSTHSLQQQEINSIKTNINEATDKMSIFRELETKHRKKVKELEEKMKDAKGHRERLLKEAEEEMRRCQKMAENSHKNWKQREQDYETLNLEIAELEKGLETSKQTIAEVEESLGKLRENYNEIQTEVSAAKEVVAQLQQNYKAEKGSISEKNKDIQKKMSTKEQLLSQVSEDELEIKRQVHEIKKKKDDYAMSIARLDEYRKNKPDDKALKDASELDDAEGKELEKKIRTLQEKCSKLKRTVNTKAQSMFDQEEKQYSQLLKKKAIVESDKKKLLAVMADLDKKKQEALALAFTQVSKDFGSIFNTLLPGTNAKLQPVGGRTILDGLEIKVFLGGLWNDSLTELSGGQRSLVALSLILAMLLFKPAPLYILDEVDAALDLSHTQNIGTLFKSYFNQSQFLIVSLKGGLFSSANVLFQTKFVDGISTIVRTVNRNN